MPTKTNEVNIRFVSNSISHTSIAGHQIRTLTERHICDWLNAHGITHQHASDIFIVKAAANGSPQLFVPDITLKRKTRNGRSIIVESLHSFSPKRGGMKALHAFHRQYHDQFYIMLVGKRAALENLPKGVADARNDLENLDGLARKLAKLMS